MDAMRWDGMDRFQIFFLPLPLSPNQALPALASNPVQGSGRRGFGGLVASCDDPPKCSQASRARPVAQAPRGVFGCS